MLCLDNITTVLWFFTSSAPPLLYYSHITTMVMALLVGVYVFIYEPKRLPNQLLFVITILFSLWVLINLLLWTNSNSSLMLFGWSLLGLIQALIAYTAVRFVHAFIYHEDIGSLQNTIWFFLVAPVVLFTPTVFNLNGFDLTDCSAFDYENPFFTTYYASLGVLASAWISVFFWRQKSQIDASRQKEIKLVVIGTVLFLTTFFVITNLAGLLTTFEFLEDSRLEFFGLFGMSIFMVLIGVMIVEFKSFNVGMHISSALVASLTILTAAKYTFSTSRVDFILTTITLILIAGAGYALIRSVRKEIRLRRQIETLAGQLQRANTRLAALDKKKSEFVSIASHQLRSPLAAVIGYASMLKDGSFGKLPQKALEATERIEQSAKLMVSSVEDYLNVSRIESGTMKYNFSDFNLRDEVEHICDDLRNDALKKGVVIYFKQKITSQGVVHADIGKTQQIIHNLINNAIKYTPKGSVTVTVRDNKKMKLVYVDIEDTGIGMSKNTLDTIFQKFERGDNANAVNVKGTGLGLYTAYKLAEAMKGSVTADSAGEGKGSKFTFELPLML